MSTKLVISALAGGVAEEVVRTIFNASLPQEVTITNHVPDVQHEFEAWNTRGNLSISHGVFLYGHKHTQELYVELVVGVAMDSGIFLADTSLKGKTRKTSDRKLFSINHFPVDAIPHTVYCIPVNEKISQLSDAQMKERALRRIANEIVAFSIKNQDEALLQRKAEVLERLVSKQVRGNSQKRPRRNASLMHERFYSLW